MLRGNHNIFVIAVADYNNNIYFGLCTVMLIDNGQDAGTCLKKAAGMSERVQGPPAITASLLHEVRHLNTSNTLVVAFRSILCAMLASN
jgi:hypothetical protein